jgi:hypothetical protein
MEKRYKVLKTKGYQSQRLKMAMSRLSKQAEQRLTEALEKVATLVSEGEHPNDAIVKVASDGGIPAGHVNLMVTAFNTGRTETQRKIGQDIFEKSAEFDLADAEEILNRMYPKEVKSAAAARLSSVVSEEYAAPPTWHRDSIKKATFNQELPPLTTRAGTVVKSVEPLPADPVLAMKKAHCQAADTRRELENRRAEVSNLQDNLISSITKLAEYFRQPGCEPYLGVKGNMVRLFDKKASALFKMLETRNPRLIKQAGDGSEFYSLVNFQKEPYALVRKCLTEAEVLVEKQASFNEFEKQAKAQIEEKLLPFAQSQDPSRTPGVLASVEKTAADLFGLASPFSASSTMLGFDSAADRLNKAIGAEIAESQLGTKQKALGKVMSELEDPKHIGKLRNLQASSLLTGLMANDDVISGYDPEEVMGHYNELSQIAPRAALHEGIMRAMLRRRLAGGSSAIDPYEIGEVLKFENQLKERDTDPYKKKSPPGVI